MIFTSNTLVYGKNYGSGKCYYCTNCHAYVGTHVPRPNEALGILSNKEMRNWKMKCHHKFDSFWKDFPSSKKRYSARNQAYKRLAEELGIPVEECHFGWFDLDMLQKAYQALCNWTSGSTQRR